jgi:type IV secretory pathway TraG/TraD family ATPase VirD4
VTLWKRLNRWGRTGRHPTKAPRDDLDTPLLAFDRENVLTLRGLLSNLIIFGRTGSGKTSGSGRALLRGILNHPRSGGILLANKPEDRHDFERLAQETGRLNDVLWFSSQEALRFNVLDHVHRVSGGNTAEIVACLMTVGETLKNGGANRRGGEDADFWRKLSEETLYHAVQVLKLAEQRVTSADLQRFLNGAARSADDLRSETWRQDFHSQVLKAALAVEQSPRETLDTEAAVEFYLHHWPHLADRTRSSIEVGVNSILFVFNTGLARELISTATNFDIGQLAHGKWLFVDTSPSVLGDAGLLVGASLKYVVERDILRRDARAGEGFTVVWLDEYAQWATSFEARTFLPMCRSHRGCLVALTQSVHGLRATLGGANEHEANALLANFHHRIFHALGSAEDADFASSLVGKRHRLLLGGSLAPAESIGDELWGGRSRFTSSFSQQLEAVIQPRAFLNGLRCGGPENQCLTDVIIVRTGEPFAHGENCLRATFRQS